MEEKTKKRSLLRDIVACILPIVSLAAALGIAVFVFGVLSYPIAEKIINTVIGSAGSGSVTVICSPPRTPPASPD